MVAGLFSFPSVPIDEYSVCSFGHRSGSEEQIDTHSAAFVKVTVAVVPPRIQASFVVVIAEQIGEAPIG